MFGSFVPGLSVARGLHLFVDVTVLCPLTALGQARPGTSNAGGRLLQDATVENDRTYHDVASSGLGILYSLGAEPFGPVSYTHLTLRRYSLCRSRWSPYH